MLWSLLLAAAGQTPPPFEFSVNPGLRVTVEGIPVVSGSWLQYYEDGWTKGYYSTSNDPPPVTKVDADTYRVDYSGYGGEASGRITYHRSGNHLQVHYEMHWSGAKPAKIELTAGALSAEVFQHGSLLADGATTRSLQQSEYIVPGIPPREFAPDASSYQFTAQLLKLGIKTSSPATLFDARGFDQDYAQGRSLFWLGNLAMDVSNDKPASYDVDWEIDPTPVPAAKSASIQLSVEQVPNVWAPNDAPLPIIPQPKTNELKPDKPLILTGNFDWPAGHVRFWEQDFLGGLKQRFQTLGFAKGASAINVDGGVSKLGLHPGGYQITVTATSISVLGEEDEGLHNGLRRLAMLAFAHGGKLVLPTGYLSSNPHVTWRGIHLFAGPEARSFQQKLWQKVLLPLGFNKVVLECERTKWDCLPNVRGEPDYMSKADLAALFDDYRKIGVEPIPLIESFGHMEWLFKNSQNLDLAFNPKEPYTVNPRKPQAEELLTKLWDEACALLSPSTIHFGCDEVDMRGFPENDAGLVTDLWIRQMPFLKQIADKHTAQMIIWGDMCLAPTEAIDATNGQTVAEATARRAAVPKGAWIADWHYKPDPQVEPYLPSLDLWKSIHLWPIASAWYEPNDVRGMDAAVDAEKAGTLQTTWAGYVSSENAMFENWPQFTAMVLASDYAWGGRYDKVTALPYDPAQVFRRLYFEQPEPITPTAGFQAYQGPSDRDVTDAEMRIKLGAPIVLRSLLSARDAPTAAELACAAKGRHIAIAIDTLDHCDKGETVASVSIMTAGDAAVPSIPLIYGMHVGAAGESDSVPFADKAGGLWVYRIDLPSEVQVTGLHLETADARGGLRLHGLIIW